MTTADLTSRVGMDDPQTIDELRARLRYAARVLGSYRARCRANGVTLPSEVVAVEALLARHGHARPGFDAADLDGHRLAMTYEDAAAVLSVSARTLRRLVERGELPTVNIGGCRRVATEDLRAYVENRRDGR